MDENSTWHTMNKCLMVCMYLRQARPQYLGMMQVLVDYVSGGAYR